MTSRWLCWLLLFTDMHVLVAGCAPTTPIRRTALVPAATAPSRLGPPLKAKEIRLAGQLNPVRLLFDTEPIALDSAENDPGLLIPVTQVGALAYVGLARFLEIGGQVHFAPRRWARKNVPGVLGLSKSDASVLMAGFGARASYKPTNTALTLSASTEFNWVRIVQAVYVCTIDPCVDTAGVGDRGLYALDRIDRRAFLLPGLFFHLGGDVGKYFHVAGFVGAEANVKNNGLDPDTDADDSSTLSKYVVWVSGMAVEGRIDPMFFNASLVTPIVFEDATYSGPSVVLQTGVSF